MWVEDDQFDIEHHVRHSALPKPGRVRELFELVSRLHSTRLATERPLWEWHLIEGLRDGRVAMYTKLHHSLVDGISAMRLLQSILSSDPDDRGSPAPWAKRPPSTKAGKAQEAAEQLSSGDTMSAVRTALGISADAAGIPKALIQTLNKSLRNETSTLSLYAPNTILNREITASRRFAAQDWPLAAHPRDRQGHRHDAERRRARDVQRRDAHLPLRARRAARDHADRDGPGRTARQEVRRLRGGGNAVGSIMVKLGTDLPDAESRLKTVHASMRDGKDALSTMTPLQIQAMSAVGQVPAILPTLLGLTNLSKPAYNLVISNVPGPRTTQYFNGAELLGTYPLSVPIDGNALNITCNSYADQMAFGLTGCRRTVPHLQRILTYLDDEIGALEKAAGL